MIIRYTNGYTFEGTLLSRTEQSLRVMTQGSEDVLEFTLTNGGWVGEDCEPVQVEFAYAPKSEAPQPKEEDCICSHELAAQLIHRLFAGENETEVAPAKKAMAPPVLRQMV